MTAVLIVCAAGASSTFLAHRLRSAARAESLDVEFAVTALADLPGTLAVVAPRLVLVGSHLGGEVDSITQLAEAAGAVTRLLPEVGLDSESISAVLALVGASGPSSIDSTDLHNPEGATRA